MTSAPRSVLVEVVVSNMAKTLDFYRMLGIETPRDAGSQPHVEAELPGGLRIAFDTVETILSFKKDWTPPQGGHRINLAFQCDTPADVDRLHDELVGAGHSSKLAPFDAFWGQRYAVVSDPDGNPVDLYARLAT
ncbi:VOC family protein [Micromonospora chokoriensis]